MPLGTAVAAGGAANMEVVVVTGRGEAVGKDGHVNAGGFNMCNKF